jgi:hypothetical protein
MDFSYGNTIEVYVKYATSCLSEGWSHAQFLLALCMEEQQGRTDRRIERYL